MNSIASTVEKQSNSMSLSKSTLKSTTIDSLSLSNLKIATNSISKLISASQTQTSNGAENVFQIFHIKRLI